MVLKSSTTLALTPTMKAYARIIFFYFLSQLPTSLEGQVLLKTRIKVLGGSQVVLRDTSFITKRDTVISLNEEEIYQVKIRSDPYRKSANFYDSLEVRSVKSKVSTGIFDLVIRKKKRKVRAVTVLVKAELPFMPYRGYRIASLNFHAVPILEGSVLDTLQEATTRLGKVVNKLHKDTRKRIVRNNLLFEVGDVVDPYLMADNERLLRQFPTLKDARIYLKLNKENPDEVDVVIVTQDVNSLGVSGRVLSVTNYRADIFDKNMLGYARQLKLSYFKNTNGIPIHGIESILYDPNLFASFLQGELQYTNNYLRKRSRLTVGRDFFASNIKYAGGIEVYKTKENFYFEDYDTLALAYTENALDVWVGRSFEFEKRKNIILAMRINPRHFPASSTILQDSNSFFRDRTLLLSSVTYVNRNYLKTLRIRGFGRTEDVPTGGSLTLLGGKEWNTFADRKYVEINSNYGNYFSNFGYINISFVGGTYLVNREAEDGLVSFTTQYFSDLKRWRKNQIRQFVNASYVRGFNRILDRSVGINGKWESSNGLRPTGNARLNLSFETVYFMSWYVYGFQFALYHRFDWSSLSSIPTVSLRNNNFTSFSLGMRTLNENLVFPTFSFEFSYFAKSELYPSLFQFTLSTSISNSFRNSLSGKPTASLFN